MFTQLTLALRNVRRNKARSALTLGAIGFGVLIIGIGLKLVFAL